MNAAVRYQLGQCHPGGLSPNRIEAGQQHCFRRVIDHHVDTGHLFEGPDVAVLSGPMIRPFMSSPGRWTAETTDSDVRLRCQALDRPTMICCDLASASRTA